jgi:Gpi18-like mannosyltransferase
MSSQKVTAYLSRFATGVCQVFLLVYYPIWIDKYGKDQKTKWLTLLQICVPVGIFAGYGMTALILSFGYHVNMLLFSIICLFTFRSDWWHALFWHFYSYPKTSLTADGD